MHVALKLDREAPVPRAVPRRKAFQLVTVRLDGVEHRSHLLDVSRLGALLHGSFAIAPNAELVVECDRFILRCRVVWARDNRFGVTFVLPLFNDQVEAIATA